MTTEPTSLVQDFDTIIAARDKREIGLKEEIEKLKFSLSKAKEVNIKQEAQLDVYADLCDKFISELKS